MSQRMATCTWSLLSRFHDKTHHAAERYTTAFNALNVLDPGGDWIIRFKPLDYSKDLRSPRRDLDEDPTESGGELSWIWLVQHADNLVASADEINDSRLL